MPGHIFGQNRDQRPAPSQKIRRFRLAPRGGSEHQAFREALAHHLPAAGANRHTDGKFTTAQQARQPINSRTLAQAIDEQKADHREQNGQGLMPIVFHLELMPLAAGSKFQPLSEQARAAMRFFTPISATPFAQSCRPERAQQPQAPSR